jgi:hypothetical protein
MPAVTAGLLCRDEAAVQEAGCREIARLRPADAARASGAVAVVLAALKHHPRAKGVQLQGIRAMANIAAGATGGARRQILAARGMEVVLLGMAAFDEMAALQEAGCGAIANLVSADAGEANESSGAEALREAARVGAIEAAVRACRTHPSGAGLRRCHRVLGRPVPAGCGHVCAA